MTMTYSITELQAGLLRGLVRQEYRRTLRQEVRARAKFDGNYDGERTEQRREFLSGIHESLGGRRLTKDSIGSGKEAR